MSIFRKTLLATTLIGAGIASTTGSAFAHESHGDDTHQHGLANVSDLQTITPANVCSLDVPINALGVQIPVQDVAADIPVLSGASDHSGHDGSVSKGCTNPQYDAN